MEISNAWLATQLRAQMLQELVATVKNNPAAILARIEPSTLKLIKDAEDRGLGSPQTSAAVQVTNPDGSLGHGPVKELATLILDGIHGKPAAS
jgi:hypothetical protein